MARIELEITGNIKGLQGALGGAVAALNSFEKASNSSTSEAESGLEKVDSAAKRVDRTFTLLSKAPFSFGVNGAKAANQVTSALEQTEKQAQGLNRTFSLIKNPSFSFGVGALGGIKQSADEAAPAVRNLTRSISGANTVGIEFSRIIQDAPYGIIGVGNNITQLTQSFANLRAQTTSTGQALSVAFRSMFSGANLLVLGVSAATTAFTLYNMWARKNKQDTDSLTASVEDYVASLVGQAAAQVKGEQEAQKQLTVLKLLYDNTQNLLLAEEERINSANEILRLYPKQFQGLTTEAILTGQAASAYEKLSSSILATAMAMAAVDEIRKNSTSIITNNNKLLEEQEQLNKVNVEIEKLRASLSSQGAIGVTGSSSAAAYNILANVEKRREGILGRINDIETDNARLNGLNQSLAKEYNNQLQNGADITGKVSGKLEKGKKEISETVKLTESLRKLQQESIQASLDGYGKELQASQNKYDELRRQADNYYREGKVSAREYADYIARLQGFRVGEAGRIIQGAGSMSVPLGQGRPTSTGVVPTQLPNQIANVVSSDPVWDDFVDGLDKQLGRAVQHFGRDFLRTLSTINQQANVTFGGVVNSIVGSLTGGITEVVSTVFTQQLGDSIKGVFQGEGGKAIAGWSAGLSVAGSIASGAFKQTSVGGQALGGALAGAGSGLAIGASFGSAGGPIGAVIGGAVGAIAGALGASSAKRIQQEQLAEERKQTALLERANALSYASSIMGQMTAGGAVTGIMRDAFGQLVATVKGSDLQFVLQRAGGSR